ncbi:MAG: Gfo/Idh/MocA family oxidoreductase [Thermoleophilia bacterium]|nr:Gfo/Idh/MocA family oxidoreductase [Thermoleophilia bacterium]
MSFRVGLLSTARINREILAGASQSDAVDVVAVASRERSRAEAYAREWGLARAYGSYDDLLADPEVDGVYNPLPNSLHVPWSERSLAAGKHVLCEKPLSRHLCEAQRAFALAEERGLVLMEAFMYRHHPQTRRVRELVTGGAIGRLRAIRSAFSFPLSDRTNIRMLAELDGGSLMDVGCYCVSGSRLLAGEPELVQAVQVLDDGGVDLAFHGTMRFPRDVVAQFHSSFVAPSRQVLEAIGEEGMLLVEAPWRQDWGGDVLLARGGKVERIDVPAANAYRLELENLAAAARGEALPLLGREDALAQASAIEALYRAAAQGGSVSV